MAKTIHPTAVIADTAVIGDGVSIGAYCVIGASVVIGDGCQLHSHVVIDGRTTLGMDNEIFPFAVLGKAPQHKGYGGEDSRLIIGDRNLIREGVSMHIGTKLGAMQTVVGNDNMFFAGSHVAHDCIIGNKVLFTNDSMAGGHVEVGDFAYLGANSGIKPWVRIGHHAMIAGLTAVISDVIPFGNVAGHRGEMVGLNLVGLRRQGFSRGQIAVLQRVYDRLFSGDGVFSDRLEQIRKTDGHHDIVATVLDFIAGSQGQPLSKPPRSKEK